MSGNLPDGGQMIVDYLVQEKVPYAFGLCGHGNIGLIDALYERSSDIATISVHHETVAGFMADVYYRVSGQPTATFTSCGPGSANLPICLANSFFDSVPFLAVTGNVPTMRWNPKDKSRFREVVYLALFEVLDNAYNDMFQKALLKLYTLPPGTHSVGHAPELFTILRLREKEKENGVAADSAENTKYILYPDPPLGDEEIRLLQDLSPDMRFITPTMLPVIEYQVESL